MTPSRRAECPTFARTALALVLIVPFLLEIGCASTPRPEERDEKLPRLYVSPDSFDFDAHPELLNRLRSDPYAYFRFINRDFSQAVCERFSEVVGGMPSVNLHGDAHLEQYAVTTQGRGLMDFDDSSTGPAVIDLVRFGVSIRLAARARGWSERTADYRRAFIEGYLGALRDPDIQTSEPRVVSRLRAEFDFDRASFLAKAESLMEPWEDPSIAPIGLDLFTQDMARQHPRLPPRFFEVKKGGPLSIGVGSALDLKYLLRVEGPSPVPEDDLIFEAKSIRDLSGIDCVHRRQNDPFQILNAQSRLAYQPYEYVGYVYFDPRRAEIDDDRRFWDGSILWVHSWIDHYTELSIKGSLNSADELAEIVRDVAVQLGRGHPREIASPLDEPYRRVLLGMVETYRNDVIAAIEELTEDCLASWELFREETSSLAAARRD